MRHHAAGGVPFSSLVSLDGTGRDAWSSRRACSERNVRDGSTWRCRVTGGRQPVTVGVVVPRSVARAAAGCWEASAIAGVRSRARLSRSRRPLPSW